MRTVVNVAAIQTTEAHKKILLVKKGRVWILPGGKAENGENDATCLVRELREELPGAVLDLDGLGFYKKFLGTTPHTRRHIKAKVYLGDIEGKPVAASELDGLAWTTFEGARRLRLSRITRRVLDDLKRSRFL